MTFEYNKICRLCLNHSNTYLMNIFNNEYHILEKISDLMNIEVFVNDPFPKVICTDCYSNLVIFNEFKNICKNSDQLLRKYQINKNDAPETDVSHNTKGNGKCKSIRNSEEMANRIKECAYKKSMTFVDNMKNFYFLYQIGDIETGAGGQVIIKNEITSETLMPNVEINIKNEIIYPNEESHSHHMLMGNVIQQNDPSGSETKRKKRKNNKRKSVNGQTMEIDETGNLVARQIVVATSADQHQSNLMEQHQNDNNEMALMLTVKASDGQHQTITVGSQHHTIQSAQPTIQIHSNHALPTLTPAPTSSHQTIQTVPSTVTTTILPQIQYSCSSCNDIFNTMDAYRQHLFHAHQTLFPFSTASTSEHQYQTIQLPQSSVSQTATIQPTSTGTIQYTFAHPHKKYFDAELPCILCGFVSKTQDELIRHMMSKHTATSGAQVGGTSATQHVIVERESLESVPTDLSNSTNQFK